MSETSVKYMSNAGDSPDSTATFLRRFIDVAAIEQSDTIWNGLYTEVGEASPTCQSHPRRICEYSLDRCQVMWFNLILLENSDLFVPIEV